MKKYIKQLIEDLEEAARQIPSIPYFETPSYFENNPEIVELALIPFKPISEWTNIEIFAFPDVIELDGKEIQILNKAIRKVLKKLNVDIVDLPKDLPEELFYEIVSDYWDYPIQYLPSSGFDMEICSGNPQTCLYGEYCDCSKYIKAYKIPDEIVESIEKVAQMIENGQYCSLNVLNGKIKEFANETDYINELVFPKPGYIYYEPINENDEISYMRFFIDLEDDENIRSVFELILEQENVIENFNNYINKLSYNEDWEIYKKSMPESIVKEKYFKYCEEEENGYYEINGFYNDDGTKVDIENIAVPAMCMSCKSFYTEAAEENLLCMMNRYDQRNNADFSCGEFENI